MARTKAKEEVIVVGEETAAPARAPKAAAPIQVPISFDAWWIQAAGKYGLDQALKQSVKRHFEARGFMEHKKFNQGLRDFGFRT